MTTKEAENTLEETETTEVLLEDEDKKTSKKLERKPSAFAETVIEVREKKGVLQAAIPTMPRWYAWICLFFNVFVPGLGTFFMSFPALFGAKTNSKKPNKCVDFLLNLAAAFLQLVTAVVIVGWIFSISWGMHFVNQANEAHAKKKQAPETRSEAI